METLFWRTDSEGILYLRYNVVTLVIHHHNATGVHITDTLELSI